METKPVKPVTICAKPVKMEPVVYNVKLLFLKELEALVYALWGGMMMMYCSVFSVLIGAVSVKMGLLVSSVRLRYLLGLLGRTVGVLMDGMMMEVMDSARNVSLGAVSVVMGIPVMNVRYLTLLETKVISVSVL